MESPAKFYFILYLIIQSVGANPCQPLITNQTINSNTTLSENDQKTPTWVYVAGGAAAGAAVGVAACACLPCLGFGTAGVAAGSAAAGIQSSIGAVTAGSAFATAQSIGATMGIATVAGSAAAGSVVGAGGGLAVDQYKNSKSLLNSNCTDQVIDIESNSTESKTDKEIIENPESEKSWSQWWPFGKEKSDSNPTDTPDIL